MCSIFQFQGPFSRLVLSGKEGLLFNPGLCPSKPLSFVYCLQTIWSDFTLIIQFQALPTNPLNTILTWLFISSFVFHSVFVQICWYYTITIMLLNQSVTFTLFLVMICISISASLPTRGYKLYSDSFSNVRVTPYLGFIFSFLFLITFLLICGCFDEQILQSILTTKWLGTCGLLNLWSRKSCSVRPYLSQRCLSISVFSRHMVLRSSVIIAGDVWGYDIIMVSNVSMALVKFLLQCGCALLILICGVIIHSELRNYNVMLTFVGWTLLVVL